MDDLVCSTLAVPLGSELPRSTKHCGNLNFLEVQSIAEHGAGRRIGTTMHLNGLQAPSLYLPRHKRAWCTYTMCHCFQLGVMLVNEFLSRLSLLSHGDGLYLHVWCGKVCAPRRTILLKELATTQRTGNPTATAPWLARQNASPKLDNLHERRMLNILRWRQIHIRLWRRH